MPPMHGCHICTGTGRMLRHRSALGCSPSGGDCGAAAKLLGYAGLQGYSSATTGCTRNSTSACCLYCIAGRTSIDDFLAHVSAHVTLNAANSRSCTAVAASDPVRCTKAYRPTTQMHVVAHRASRSEARSSVVRRRPIALRTTPCERRASRTNRAARGRAAALRRASRCVA
jgi:hypothetical protein